MFLIMIIVTLENVLANTFYKDTGRPAAGECRGLMFRDLALLSLLR